MQYGDGEEPAGRARWVTCWALPQCLTTAALRSWALIVPGPDVPGDLHRGHLVEGYGGLGRLHRRFVLARLLVYRRRRLALIDTRDVARMHRKALTLRRLGDRSTSDVAVSQSTWSGSTSRPHSVQTRAAPATPVWNLGLRVARRCSAISSSWRHRPVATARSWPVALLRGEAGDQVGEVPTGAVARRHLLHQLTEAGRVGRHRQWLVRSRRVVRDQLDGGARRCRARGGEP